MSFRLHKKASNTLGAGLLSTDINYLAAHVDSEGQGEDWGRILRRSQWFCQNTETYWRLPRLRLQTDYVNCQNIIIFLCTSSILLLQAYRPSNCSLILWVCSLIKDDQSAQSVRIISQNEKIHVYINIFIYSRVLICTRLNPYQSESTNVYQNFFKFTTDNIN